jgi:hypothetical protein
MLSVNNPNVLQSAKNHGAKHMPEKVIGLLENIGQSLIFFVIGASIALGQSMANGEPANLKIIIGRALTVGGLAMAAGAVLAWFPDLPFVGQVGFAAALASLGSSGIERIIFRYLDAKRGQ